MSHPSLIRFALIILLPAVAGLSAARTSAAEIIDVAADSKPAAPFGLTLTQADPNPAPLGVPHVDPRPFAKGSRTFQLYGSTVLLDSDHGYISTAHAGLGYHLADDFSFNIEGLGGWVDSKVDDDGGVAGLDLLLRHHFAHDRERDWTLYVDGGAGFQQASTNFPSDSHHNFRTMVGLGGTLRLTDALRLMGGARYLHISNAGTSDRNDGGDWAQLYLGAMWTF